MEKDLITVHYVLSLMSPVMIYASIMMKLHKSPSNNSARMFEVTKKLQERRDEVAHSRALNLKKNYKQNELDIYVNAKRSYKKGFDACYSELMPEIQKLVDYYAFCLGAALNLYRPDNPVHKGLDPTFYHTLTYDGDIELIKKTLEAEIVLNQFKKFMGPERGEGG